MNNQVAVIISIYKNDSIEYICKSIDSILNQTYKNLSIFIGIDGPVGVDIEECLNSYARNKNIEIFKYETNRGLASVLNDLLRVCFSKNIEYIARMDADDISLPHRIEKQISFLISNPEIDVVGGANERIDAQGNRLGRFVYSPLTPEECFKTFARRTPLTHPAVMFRKSYFDKAGCLYRPEYRNNQDIMLWYDGLKKGVKMANINDVILLFRVTDDLIGVRRSGYKRAKKQLIDRFIINRNLGYSLDSYLYALGVFFYMICPISIRRFIYNRMR